MSERLVEVASKSRHDVIAGGGPAGPKVAEIAARRGHRAALLERSSRLGGCPHRAGRGLRGATVDPEHDSGSLRIGASSVGKDKALKIAFNTWVYSSFPVWVPSYPMTETIERIAAIGYDGIEIGAAGPHA